MTLEAIAASGTLFTAYADEQRQIEI